jgi:uncharacterized protein with FMN-binding domain
MSQLIVAIKNIANKGKTSTIKLVAEKLYLRYLNEKKEFYGEVNEVIDVIIKNKQIRIGIISQGDPTTGLKDKLVEKISNQCDVIICATRTSGETVNAVNDVSKSNNGLVIWTTTYEINDKSLHIKMNNLKSNQIIDLIESMH